MGIVLKKCAAAVLCGSVIAANLSFPVFAEGSYGMGDVNGDGNVTSADASDILFYYAEVSSGRQPQDWSDERISAANVDFNKDVTAADASLTLRYYSYISSTGSDEPETYFAKYRKFCNVRYDEQFDLDVKITSGDMKNMTLTWNDLGGTAGYYFEMYCYDMDTWERVTVTEERLTTNSVTVTLPEKMTVSGKVYLYSYCIQPFSEFYGEERKWDNYEASNFYSSEFAIEAAVNNANLTPHDSYPLYNIKGATPYKADTYYVSAADKKILDDFAASHFTSGMTNYDKINYTINWLNENVTYASGDLYKEIWADSWVVACFQKRKGQCLQYNGALAEMLAYMGYDVYMLEMWLGNNTNQHFRAEVNIDGQAYSLEVGNAGQSGSDWKWSFTPIESSIG